MRFHLGPYLAFAAFGVFWGTWGAALPALRDEAQLTEGQLGAALLCVGAGALPAMLFTGRAVDRFGVRITGLLLLALAGSGILLAWQATDPLSITIAMLLIGATSGASDVAANALAALGEARSHRRVITLSHAVFSSFVVAASLGAGALRAAGHDVTFVFSVAGLLMAAAGAIVFIRGDGRPLSESPVAATSGGGTARIWPFIAIGSVGALGFAAENAHQSWSAIFLEDELHVGLGFAALAPATFAAAAAITRFTVGSSARIPDRVLLIGGATVASIGSVVVAFATSIPVALMGLAFAAIGMSVLFPTLLSSSLRGVPDERRGRATSAIGATAYLGFVFGPVYVGMLAGLIGLRGAMIGVAALTAVFALAAPMARRLVTGSNQGHGLRRVGAS
ncbi:MFS transporter [Microbacterium murale]|uniref:MFS family arabinose efflux permease n=1 Tax=Microbacterium murale TaxID=1081040 RepID=A0ABU0P8Y5_9MICO|nr:MFS transporter [Microbacterium murale]MDQ0643802.1 putative MFS family arabinose efflux permease [Microbacterium murale]